MFMIVQIDVLSKGMGEHVFTEWTGQERCNAERLLQAEGIGHVGRLCHARSEEEGL